MFNVRAAAAFSHSVVPTHSAAVLRLRHAQPEQRHVVRILCKYRTPPHTAQSHHAERSTEAAKQNRLLTDSARRLQVSLL